KFFSYPQAGRPISPSFWGEADVLRPLALPASVVNDPQRRREGRKRFGFLSSRPVLGSQNDRLWNGAKGNRSASAEGRGTGDCCLSFHAPDCRVGLSWDASRSHVLSVTPRSRNLYFCTLPLSVVGSACTNSRYRGTAK